MTLNKQKSILNSDNQREIVFKILIVDMSDRLIITSVHQWFVMHTEYRIRIRIRILYCQLRVHKGLAI